MPSPATRRGLAAVLLTAAVSVAPLLATSAAARPLEPTAASAFSAPLPEQDVEVLFFDDFEDATVGLLPSGVDPDGNFAVGYEDGEYVVYQANPD